MRSERIKIIEEKVTLFLSNLFSNVISSNNDYVHAVLTMENIFDIFHHCFLLITLYPLLDLARFNKGLNINRNSSKAKEENT